MSLSESYTQKPNAIPSYFDAILDAQPPERFSLKFLVNLGFTEVNDRLLIGILKDLGLLNRDGAPQPRYYDFLDRSRSRAVIADGIKEGFGDLFAIHSKANELPLEDIKNKLKTLFAGKKSNLVIDRIAKTFKALADYADFSQPTKAVIKEEPKEIIEGAGEEKTGQKPEPLKTDKPSSTGQVRVQSLQYHINIVLPDTRDQAVYDAIFKSLRDHLS